MAKVLHTYAEGCIRNEFPLRDYHVNGNRLEIQSGDMVSCRMSTSCQIKTTSAHVALPGGADKLHEGVQAGVGSQRRPYFRVYVLHIVLSASL